MMFVAVGLFVTVNFTMILICYRFEGIIGRSCQLGSVIYGRGLKNVLLRLILPMRIPKTNKKDTKLRTEAWQSMQLSRDLGSREHPFFFSLRKMHVRSFPLMLTNCHFSSP